MLSIFPYTTVDRDEPINIKALSQINDLFLTVVEQTVDVLYPLDLALFHKYQQKELINRDRKLIAYMRG